MSTENLTTPGATALRTSFPEAAIVADDADWDAARAAFNLLQDQRPAAVARPRSAPRPPRSSPPRATPVCGSRPRARRTTRSRSARSTRR